MSTRLNVHPAQHILILWLHGKKVNIEPIRGRRGIPGCTLVILGVFAWICHNIFHPSSKDIQDMLSRANGSCYIPMMYGWGEKVQKRQVAKARNKLQKRADRARERQAAIAQASDSKPQRVSTAELTKLLHVPLSLSRVLWSAITRASAKEVSPGVTFSQQGG